MAAAARGCAHVRVSRTVKYVARSSRAGSIENSSETPTLHSLRYSAERTLTGL